MENDLYLVINSLGGGGAERVCVTLANELKSRNFPIKIIIFYNKKNSYIEFLDKEIDVINFESKSTFAGYIDLMKFVLKYKPRRIIALTEIIASICILCRKINRSPMKIIARNINNMTLLKENSHNWRVKLLFNFTKIFYADADKFIAQSQGMKDDMVNNWNIDKDKIMVINNPVSEVISKFSENTIYLKEEQPNFLFVGRLEQQKGIEYLIEAISICKKRGVNIIVNIIGTGSLYNKIKQDIIDNGINDNINLLGYKDNVEKYYIKAKGVILCSLYEGFPNVLIESITLGIPVISFDCPSGPSEIIKDGVNGFLVKYLDANDLADKIIKASSYIWNVDKIKITSDDYKIEKILDKYEDIIRDVFHIT